MQIPDPTNPADLALWRRVSGPGAPAGSACLELADLAAWLDGRVADAEAERIEAHLADCRACLAAVRELRTLLAASPGESMLPSPRVIRAARALVPAAVPETTVLRFPWTTRLAPARWAVAAAAVLLTSYAGYHIGHRTFDPGAGASTELISEMSFGILNGIDNDLGLDALPVSGEGVGS